MAKKRKAKYTQEELAIHKEAVRLRNKSDRQLVEEFHRAAEEETSVRTSDTSQEAFCEAEANKDTPDIQKLLNALSEGKCKGIKGATAYKITEFAKEMGLLV